MDSFLVIAFAFSGLFCSAIGGCQSKYFSERVVEWRFGLIRWIYFSFLVFIGRSYGKKLLRLDLYFDSDSVFWFYWY